MRHLLLPLFVLGLAACNHSGEQLRAHTYPPSFEYIDESKLHSTMWVLAREVTQLEKTLRDPAADPAAQQRAVSEILARVDAAVGGIVTPGRVTQHPLLNQNLPGLRNQVSRARAGVARTPPNYFFASELAGACSACHGSAAT
jgi:hypothetical protein